MGIRIIFAFIPLMLVVLSGHRLLADGRSFRPAGLPMSPGNAEGMPVESIIIILQQDESTSLANAEELKDFHDAFNFRPGTLFRESVADIALKKIRAQPGIASASYTVYSDESSGPVTVVYSVAFLKQGEPSVPEKPKGMAYSRSIDDFPVISETDHSKLVFIMNGAIGGFNDYHALFSKGAEFTKGNPVADDPAGKGGRLWNESFLEGGIGGIVRLGQSKCYGYGALSALASSRISDDIYSGGTTGFIDIERLYAGFLAPGIGKDKDLTVDLSYGRQFFQLNDGFLISKYSGSANAGDRGSLYLNSRTAFEKVALLKSQYRSFGFNAFLLEPEELFEENQLNTRYAGAGLMYNDNSTIDAGVTYIDTAGGTSRYRTPQGPIQKKGMYIINPKLWLNDIAGTGIFIKSEYAFQAHHSEAMRANGWYSGIGIKKSEWKYRPSLYYRYAYMEGDDESTSTYERFDPMLTGGLGNWVQGINFRKVIGNGNIISHRLELKCYPVDNFEVSFD